MSYQKPNTASVIVATYNNWKILEKTLNALLSQKFSGKYEIIVVNDGSTDETKEFLDEYAKGKKNLTVFHQKNQGVCRARNKAIENSQYKIVVNMDHDCIAGKNWLQKIVDAFDSESVKIASAYFDHGAIGGTSTAFRKKDLQKVGGYDEKYHYYREDTDLSFKVYDLHHSDPEFRKKYFGKPNYIFRKADARFVHDHEEAKPTGLIGFAKHVLKRLYYHQNDVLLYKKHSTELCKKFLHIKLGFVVDPMQDFRVATGTWEKGKKMNLSSPRGITFLENETPIHTLVILIGGLGYVMAVKTSRLIGSIRFGKLLI